MTTTRKITILQELEITINPPEGKTENEIYEYAMNVIKNDRLDVAEHFLEGWKYVCVVTNIDLAYISAAHNFSSKIDVLASNVSL